MKNYFIYGSIGIISGLIIGVILRFLFPATNTSFLYLGPILGVIIGTDYAKRINSGIDDEISNDSEEINKNSKNKKIKNKK